jgi:hypothetical protein
MSHLSHIKSIKCRCNKKCFTKKEAKSILNAINKDHDWRREKRMYYCEIHNAWHLTASESWDENLDIPLQQVNEWKNLINI